jgi:hypothetical protein
LVQRPGNCSDAPWTCVAKHSWTPKCWHACLPTCCIGVLSTPSLCVVPSLCLLCRTLDSKREMDIMAALDEMRTLNARHNKVGGHWGDPCVSQRHCMQARLPYHAINSSVAHALCMLWWCQL